MNKINFIQFQSLPSTQLLPVAQLISPFANTIKQAPKILNELTRDTNAELDFKGKTDKSSSSDDKNQTLTANTTSPITTTYVTSIPAENEMNSNIGTKVEKITKTPMETINQGNTVAIPNKTYNESTESLNEKRTTAISDKCNYLCF